MNEKHKMECKVLNYFEHFLVFVSPVSGFVLTSTFAPSFGVPIGIASSKVGLKICALTAWIKKYQSVVKEKMTNCNKIVLLAKAKLNTIKVLISRIVLDSYINHKNFVSVNFTKCKKKSKILKNDVEYAIQIWLI